jgi:cardiolipin synthase
VRVRLILPSVSDSPTSLAAGHAAYDDLLQAGVQIFELHGEVLHSKLAAVDGVWTLIGSSNLDRRSVAFNNEVDAVVLGQTTTADVEALFDRDAANSTAITLEQWRHRPFSERKAEFMARFMAWLL